jgi:thymidylate synthase
MKWPVFSEKELVIGNTEADIGVCTLWSPREEFARKHLNGLMEKVAAVGNLYSVYGIGFLIRNYFTNPKLRYLVVTGTELGGSKDALFNLASDDSLANKVLLDKEHIRRFLSQVKIVFSDIKGLKKLISEERFRDSLLEAKEFKPLFVPMPEPKTDIFPAPKTGHLIRARTIAEGYHRMLREIRIFGHITGKDSEKHRRQELWRLHMVITSQDPCDFASIPHPEYDKGKMKKYCKDFWEGTEPGDLAYRYGHIIRFGFGDQVEAVIAAFKKKGETFRTVISLWDPNTERGSITDEDPPCLVDIHPRIIDGRLDQGAYIRTNDMFRGWTLNAAALRYFQYRLLERLRAELRRTELRLGELEITSGSAHIYERDLVAVDAFLAEARSEKFFPDPKGNFEVSVNANEILVRHFSLEGERCLQEFRGTNAEKLSKEVAPFITQPANALYVGRELEKAEIVLKNKPREY